MKTLNLPGTIHTPAGSISGDVYINVKEVAAVCSDNASPGKTNIFTTGGTRIVVTLAVEDILDLLETYGA
ncbi:MAG: hypothetical protein KGS72_27035 [Cyanobacteria bacterium REEB67]|nr:hypothetical protein [Cyanobacteria bacterium REEB67]